MDRHSRVVAVRVVVAHKTLVPVRQAQRRPAQAPIVDLLLLRLAVELRDAIAAALRFATLFRRPIGVYPMLCSLRPVLLVECRAQPWRKQLLVGPGASNSLSLPHLKRN